MACCVLPSWSVVVMLMIIAVQKVCCLNCYTCSSKSNEACAMPDKNKIPHKYCGIGALNETRILARNVHERFDKIYEVHIHRIDPMVPTSCLKQITQVGTKEYVIRGCQLAPSENEELHICTKVKRETATGMHTKYCELCGDNGCNNSAFIKISHALMTALICSIFISYK